MFLLSFISPFFLKKCSQYRVETFLQLSQKVCPYSFSLKIVFSQAHLHPVFIKKRIPHLVRPFLRFVCHLILVVFLLHIPKQSASFFPVCPHTDTPYIPLHIYFREEKVDEERKRGERYIFSREILSSFFPLIFPLPTLDFSHYVTNKCCSSS